jgi:hypothetical protein
MTDNEETPPQCSHHGSYLPGRANYQNNILIPIIERILPKGANTWYLVAFTYKEESGEQELHSEEDLRNNWVRKLCNNFKKPLATPATSQTRFTVALRSKGAFSIRQKLRHTWCLISLSQ